jgi:hypothetical protein
MPPKYLFKDFRSYWYALDPHQRSLLAKLSGVSYNYLCRLARGLGGRKAGLQTITRLGKVDRHITLRLMRPDLAGKRRYVSPLRKRRK